MYHFYQSDLFVLVFAGLLYVYLLSRKAHQKAEKAHRVACRATQTANEAAVNARHE